MLGSMSQNNHHLGLSIITLSFVILLYKHIGGVKMVIPSTFLFSYGLGCIVLMTHMYYTLDTTYVSVLEFINVCISLYLGIVMYQNGF